NAVAGWRVRASGSRTLRVRPAGPRRPWPSRLCLSPAEASGVSDLDRTHLHHWSGKLLAALALTGSFLLPPGTPAKEERLPLPDCATLKRWPYRGKITP